MHGRVRVKTPKELEEKTAKENEEKANIFRNAMKTIFEMRNNKECDAELMSITANVLSKNPDITTLWNIRKEILKRLKNLKSADLVDLIKNELKLTASGLLANPKSYSAWYHRCWLLKKIIQNPDWEKELEVTTAFLERDDRNFHCWDYRRFVVSHIDGCLQNELEYTKEKIFNNMSNYSAWHYRTKLLTSARLNSVTDSDKNYLEEVSLVENAVFTDPLDQSAWFYQRWLMDDMSLVPLSIIQAGYDASEFFAWLSFNKPVSDKSVIIAGLGNTPWVPLCHDQAGISNVWVKTVNTYMDTGHEDARQTRQIIVRENNGDFLCKTSLTALYTVYNQVNFKFVLNSSQKKVLNIQQDSYRKLLAMEPNNKWAVLAISSIQEKLGEQIDFDMLMNIRSADSLRDRYYSDLISRYKMQQMLSNISIWDGAFIGRDASLTSFYHSHCFTLFTAIDLSNNLLGNEILPSLQNFITCRVLRLSNCQLTDISEFPGLRKLQVLDLSKNQINQSRPSGLINCTSLSSVNVSFTSITPDHIFCTYLIERNPKLKIVCS